MEFITKLVLFFNFYIVSLTENREKRFLIVPATSPTRHQLIWGVGLPLPLDDESVTSGLVFKAQYFLPTRVSDLKPAIFFSNNKRNQRDLSESEFSYDNITHNKVEKYFVNAVEIERKPIEDIYDENDEMEINYENDYLWRENYKSNSESKIKDSRWSIYKAIEGIADTKGFNGKECLLKSICEAAEAKFTHSSGLLGELFQIILSPSSTEDKKIHQSYKEYFSAEDAGKSGNQCHHLFKNCYTSFLDIFSGVMSSFS